MTVVFASNYYNHHQAPFSEAMDRLTGGNYYFIETEPMEAERVNMGWGKAAVPSFVVRSYLSSENFRKCEALIDEADIVITGSAPEHLFKDRLRAGKLIFRYSERWYKTGYQYWKWPIRLIRHHFWYGRYKNTYMLCASAYTAADCAKSGLYLNKTYKWGYFPEVKRYDDIDCLLHKKDPASILWCGRFLDWKHPDDVIRVASRLKKDGYRFHLDMIGIGEMEEKVRDMIVAEDLSEQVQLLGAMSPQQVREHMERAGIYLFTSDFNEGWGAVLNESMNSGCAVVASHAIGSVPFLIEDGKNGIVYASGNTDDLYRKVRRLLDHPEEQKRLGKAAYETLTGLWNAEVAATRVLQLAQAILDGSKAPDLFENGPCSRAGILRNRWYRA